MKCLPVYGIACGKSLRNGQQGSQGIVFYVVGRLLVGLICLGRIGPGALADLIALPVNGKLETIYEEIVHFREPIPWMMIDGKTITA